MKRLIVAFLLTLPLLLSAAETGNIVEIDVQGMTCPFCVYSVKNNLSGLDGVKTCDVSPDKNKARIEMKPGLVADIEQIRKIIIDAGFTPGEVQVID